MTDLTEDEPKRPVPTIPDNLASMTPVEAWNAAVSQCQEISGFSSFWDDGRYGAIDMEKLLIRDADGYVILAADRSE
jgi:hypothetical protein